MEIQKILDLMNEYYLEGDNDYDGALIRAINILQDRLDDLQFEQKEAEENERVEQALYDYQYIPKNHPAYVDASLNEIPIAGL